MAALSDSACLGFCTLDMADEADRGAFGLGRVAQDTAEAWLTPEALLQRLDGFLCLGAQL